MILSFLFDLFAGVRDLQTLVCAQNQQGELLMANISDLRVHLEALKDELHTDLARAVAVMNKAADTISGAGDSAAIQALMDDADAAKAEVAGDFVAAIVKLEAVA